VFGFDSSTSWSRSSSVARRFTNVVLALRSVSGSSSSARWSDALSSPIAPSPCSCCPRGREVVAALGDRGHGVGAVLQEAVEHRLVERELLRQPDVLPRNGAKYLMLCRPRAARVVLVPCRG
jgi:hypothetical protein